MLKSYVRIKKNIRFKYKEIKGLLVGPHLDGVFNNSRSEWIVLAKDEENNWEIPLPSSETIQVK